MVHRVLNVCAAYLEATLTSLADMAQGTRAQQAQAAQLAWGLLSWPLPHLPLPPCPPAQAPGPARLLVLPQ